MDYKIILYVIFGVLPSVVWLLYFLRKDVHPESNRMVIKVFLWGIAITLPVFLIQIGFDYLLKQINVPSLASSIIYWFFIISFSEEIFKYLVIKLKVLKSADLDEPLDIMLYMVIAALGFAALENILYLFAPADQIPLGDFISRTIIISFIRFVGATFLHALCSALLGYFIAISICSKNNKKLLLLSGIILAFLLHGLYDFSIMTIEGPLKLILPVVILLALASFVIASFDKLKKLKGVCQIK